MTPREALLRSERNNAIRSESVSARRQSGVEKLAVSKTEGLKKVIGKCANEPVRRDSLAHWALRAFSLREDYAV